MRYSELAGRVSGPLGRGLWVGLLSVARTVSELVPYVTGLLVVLCDDALF